MDYWLAIETFSETAPGSGESESSLVDRDIVFDPYGLPYLPARRLKGALREAAAAVTAALDLTSTPLAPVDEVFGSSGNDLPGWLRLRNLELSDANATRDWLAWAMTQHGNTLYAGQVLSTFSSIRSQTAIEAETGAAREDTLRRTRVLHRNLRFSGRLQIVAPGRPEEETAVRLLALACAATRRIGLSRNRGLGRIHTRLYADTTLQNDLTEAALDDLAARVGAA